MYILKPVIHETIWGGTKLNKYVSAGKHKIGHLYLVNGHSEMSNKILNGELKGKTLHEAFQINRHTWKLDAYEEFPLTIALVDASDDLSIQVHPDNEMAQILEGNSIGKKESWLFLEAPKQGWIYGGCKCTSGEEVIRAIQDGCIEQVTEHVSIEQNDFVTVSAGTLHSMTQGSLVYEIEYGSNYTYRFYDFGRLDSNGRERELHIDKAVKSIKPDEVPEITKMQNGQWITKGVYEVCEINDVDSYINCSKEIECISIIEGDGCCGGVCIGGGMSILLFPGEEVTGIHLQKIIIARLVR